MMLDIHFNTWHMNVAHYNNKIDIEDVNVQQYWIKSSYPIIATTVKLNLSHPSHDCFLPFTIMRQTDIQT